MKQSSAWNFKGMFRRLFISCNLHNVSVHAVSTLVYFSSISMQLKNALHEIIIWKFFVAGNSHSSVKQAGECWWMKKYSFPKNFTIRSRHISRKIPVRSYTIGTRELLLNTLLQNLSRYFEAIYQTNKMNVSYILESQVLSALLFFPK